MCPPTYFDIEYEINPWMHQDDQPNKQAAAREWQKLYKIYTERLGWHVELIEPVKNLPDMVFATDSGLVIDGQVMLSNFRYSERRVEAEMLESWLREQGYSQIKKAKHLLEGGDNLIFGDKILAGYGFRSEREAHAQLADYFNRPVISLKLVDPRFFHLDTALAILNTHTAAYYPAAFDKPSQQLLKAAVPNLLEVNLEEVKSFGLNAVGDGQVVVCSDASPSLLQKYRAAGLEVIGTPILEFRKSGGGVKCLTLELN